MTPINQGWKVKVTNNTAEPVVISGGISGAVTVTSGNVNALVSGTVNTLNGLQVSGHDYIALSYNGSTLTGVVYKTGGAGGTTIATLTLAYDGSNNLTSVTKS